jgi:hypothetical protein
MKTAGSKSVRHVTSSISITNYPKLFMMNHTGGWLGRAHVSGRRA